MKFLKYATLLPLALVVFGVVAIAPAHAQPSTPGNCIMSGGTPVYDKDNNYTTCSYQTDPGGNSNNGPLIPTNTCTVSSQNVTLGKPVTFTNSASGPTNWFPEGFGGSYNAGYEVYTYVYDSVGTHTMSASSLSNNGIAVCPTVTVDPAATLPDLKSGAPTVTTAVTGQTTSFTGLINNEGAAAAGNSIAHFSIASVTNVVTGGTGSIASGGSASVGSTYQFNTPGTYSVSLCADVGSVVAESDESNNCGSSTSFTIYSAPTASLSASPTTVTSGGSTNLTWSSTGATTCTGTNFSTGGAPSGGPVSVSPTSDTTYRIDCTGPGGSTYAQVTVPVSTPRPDLTVNASTALTATAGQAFSIPATISNVASGSTVIGFSNYYRVCDSGCTSYDQSGTSATAAMAAGSPPRAITFTHTISAAAGTYYYMVCTDTPANQVAESNEGNNCSGWNAITLAAAPQADLTAGAVIFTPSTVAAGTAINFSAQAFNNGNATSGSFPMLFQIQSGASVNSSYVGPLAASGSAWTGYDYTFSSAGTYQVRACANKNTSGTFITTESDYTNNCSAYSSVVVTAAVVPPPPSAPTCALFANPTSVATGGTSSLTWSSSNATSCTGSNFSTGGATSNSSGVTVTPSGNTTYGLTCTGAGGTCTAIPVTVSSGTCSGTGSATIQANNTDESVRVQQGSTVNLTWSASNVSGTCTVSGPGVNQTSTPSPAPACVLPSGSITTPAISTQSVYTITCTGGVTDRVVVNVIPKIIEF